jgi:hypothetical protein
MLKSWLRNLDPKETGQGSGVNEELMDLHIKIH